MRITHFSSSKSTVILLCLLATWILVGSYSRYSGEEPARAEQAISPLAKVALAAQPSSPLPSASALEFDPKQLHIDSTAPASATVGVSVDDFIQIALNRPAVTLTETTVQAELPQPLEIEPAITGVGTWVTPNIYKFRPIVPLAGATEYQVRVLPFQGIEDRTLSETLVFTFVTALPAVTGSNPTGLFAYPNAVVRVNFNQPMDVESTQAAFELQALSTKELVSGRFVWINSKRAMKFYPSQPLHFDEIYLLNLRESARPASRRAEMGQIYRSQFATVPYPWVESVYPEPGRRDFPVNEQVQIRFSTVMSETSLLEHLRISPSISTTMVYSSYNPADRSLVLSWNKEPATLYTITLDAAIQDHFGNALGDTAKAGAIISPTGVDRSTYFTFTTGDLSPFARFSFETLSHLSAYTDTQTALYYRNITKTRVSLYQLPLREFVRLGGNQTGGAWYGYLPPDPAENLLWSKTYSLNTQRNLIHSLMIPFIDRAGEPLSPGIYLVEAVDPDAALRPTLVERTQAVVLLSNASLVVKRGSQGQSLAWLTDLRTGEPIAGQPINFLVNSYYQATSLTDDAGLALANLQVDSQNSYAPLIAVSGEAGDDRFAVASSDWNDGITPAAFDLPYFNYQQGYVSHFYTDRPIYRPGQRVYWKGIIRRWHNEGYELPNSDTNVTIRIHNSQGNIISETVASLSEFGTVDGFFDLAVETITGDYTLEAVTNYGPLQVNVSHVSFGVAAYRKPEFDISVAADRAEYTQGDTIRIRTQADYFSGGPLVGAQVTWRVVASAYQFSWQPNPNDKKWPNRWFSFSAYDPEQMAIDPYASFRGGLVLEGSGVTGEDGMFTLELPADLQESLFSQQWAVDVTVQSSTNQFVNRHTEVVLHRGDYYVGLSPRSYVMTSKRANQVDLLTMRPDGRRYPGAQLAVTIYQYQWNSVYERQADGIYRWNNKVERRRVFTDTLTSDATGSAILRWTPNKGGQYLITVQSQDAHENPIGSAVMTWVSEGARGEYVAWGQPNNDRLQLVGDKKFYRPGDTAQILVTSPFSGTVKALISVERGGVLSATVSELTSNSALIAIPIEADYVPDIFVGVVLVHSANPTDPVPALRMGYLQLKVEAQSKQLTISVEPSASKLRPADTVTYTLTVRDEQGKAAAESELSVALVDKAVLALRGAPDTPLIDLFYYERGLGVATGATLIINRDRLSQEAGSGQKGGGGGGGGGLLVRQEFPDLAWWRANYVTDEAGRVQFSVKLPDNLTTWVLLVKAVDKVTRVGDARHEIVATKDLQVRPLLPRFFTAGDQALIGAALLNTTDQPFRNVGFMVRVSGATIEQPHGNVVATLAPDHPAQFHLPIMVDNNASAVVVTMTARSQLGSPESGLADSVQITIPVRRYVAPDMFAQSGVLADLSVTLPVTLTAYTGHEAELTLKVEGSLAASMVDGLNYLEHYPWECNEQTLSRFLPNLYTQRAFQTLGIADPGLQRQLNYQVAVGVQRLLARQNSDGGWGYWPGNASANFTTAYVVWGLEQARTAGYPVPDELLQAGINYLSNIYISPATAQSWELNESTFMHFVLAELGRGDPGRMSVLYDNRDRLGIYGKAYLAMAMAKVDTGNGSFFNSIDTLATEIIEATQVTPSVVSWHEATRDWQTMNSDTRSSAVVLELLLRLYPQTPVVPKVVRGLMEARRSGYWGNTQETAWSLIALTDWLSVTDELHGKYEWSALFNDSFLGSGAVDVAQRAAGVALHKDVADLLRGDLNTLTLTRSNDSGQLYYTTYLRYAMDALAVEPFAQGIQVEQYFTPIVSPTRALKVGDLVSVTLVLVAERDLHYLVVEAPLAAGLEAIDPQLEIERRDAAVSGAWSPASSSQAEKAPYLYWRPNYIDMRDDKVVLFANWLAAGRYAVTFRARATLPGNFRVLPATAQMMYADEIWGRSGGQVVVIGE